MRKTTLLLIILTVFLSCSSSSTDQYYNYGTSNDSARHYFLKGWEEILDNGRWTESEIAFRKASELDPGWLLGKSMVARITRILEERQEILTYLEARKNQVGADERMLIDVNIQSHIAANNRDQGIANSPQFNQSRRQLAEKNFGAFARKHPEDNYFKAEYIEFLHLNYGAHVALDSITHLATPRQKELGFYISFAASLELELGNIEQAQLLSDKLDKTLIDPSYLSPLVLKAQILMQKDSLEKAAELIKRVVESDPNHLIAVGMLKQLRKQLEPN